MDGSAKNGKEALPRHFRLSDYELLETPFAFDVASEIAERRQPAAFFMLSKEQSPWTYLGMWAQDLVLRSAGWVVESYLFTQS